MFDIDYLLIEPLKEHLNSLQNIEYQVLFLFQLIDFEKNFAEYSNKISDNWYKMTEERYPAEEYSFSDNDKKFIIEYAKRKTALKKQRNL